MRDEVTHTPPDGGVWAWLVCAASCWTNGTVFGIINSFGVLLVSMKDLEGADVFKTAWVGSVCAGLTFLMSPVSSFLTDRVGCRATALIGGSIASVGLFASSFVTKIQFLYVSYGVLIGTGFSIAYTPSIVILGHYFKKKIGLANGIVATGSAIFTIALPFLIQFVLDSSGLRMTLRYMALITVVMTLGSLVFSPLLQKEVKEIKDEKGVAVRKKSVVHRKQSVYNRVSPFKNVTTGIWKNKKYRIWAIGIPLGLFGYFIPFFHLVNHINDIFPEADAPIAIACLGATSGVGRLISGPLSDHPRVNGVFIQQVAYLFIGVCTTLIPICRHYISLLVIVSVMGLFDGCFVCMMGPVAFDLVGPRKAAQALGFVLGSMSIPMTVGPPVAGLIYDLVNSYTIAFILAGLSPVIGACFLMLIHRIPPDNPPEVLPEEEEIPEDIGDVFYDDINDPKLKRTNSDLGRLKREPSVRRPSRKSTVTFDDEHQVIEERTALRDIHEDSRRESMDIHEEERTTLMDIHEESEYIPPWKLHAMEMTTMGMGRKRHLPEVKNEHSLQNGDIHIHRGINGDVQNSVNKQNGILKGAAAVNGDIPNGKIPNGGLPNLSNDIADTGRRRDVEDPLAVAKLDIYADGSDAKLAEKLENMQESIV